MSVDIIKDSGFIHLICGQSWIIKIKDGKIIGGCCSKCSPDFLDDKNVANK